MVSINSYSNNEKCSTMKNEVNGNFFTTGGKFNRFITFRDHSLNVRSHPIPSQFTLDRTKSRAHLEPRWKRSLKAKGTTAIVS